MIVQVIPRKISEDSHLEGATLSPFLIEGVGGDFHDDISYPIIGHPPEKSHQIKGFRCRDWCRMTSYPSSDN